MCSHCWYSSSTASTETLHAYTVILACSDHNRGWFEGILNALAVYEGIYFLCPPHRFSMSSLLSEYVHSRNRYRNLIVERDDCLAAINRYVVDLKRVLHPFVFITTRRQVDALIHRKSIQDSFKPSSVMIR
ncbi:unnamed protein product, partial [Prunus brigantina]